MPGSAVVPITHTNLYSYLKLALDRAQDTKGWFVLILPNDMELQDRCRSIIAGILPATAKFGGRTAVLPGGGRVSVTRATDPVFIEEGTPFTTMFVGWSNNPSREDSRGMAAWRDRCSDSIDLLRSLATT